MRSTENVLWGDNLLSGKWIWCIGTGRYRCVVGKIIESISNIIYLEINIKHENKKSFIQYYSTNEL